MKQYTLNAVGTAGPNYALRDINGVGNMPVQVQITGTATFTIEGRVSKNAPWVVIRAAGSTGFLESLQYCPFIRINVSAVSAGGNVKFWIGDQ